MKSLLITSTFPPRLGGRENYLYNLFAHLPAEEVVVLTPDREGDWERFDRESPFPIIRTEPEGFQWFYQGGRRLRWRWFSFLARLCRQEEVRVVHCGTALPDGLSALLLQRTLGLPYVVYTFGLEVLRYRDQPWTHQRLMRALHEASRVVAISNFTKRELVRLGLPADKVTTIYPGLDTQRFRPDPEAGAALRKRLGLEGKKVILTLGRLVPRKGQDRVIEALPQVLRQVPDVVYLIAGDGPDRERLERLAWDQGVADHVRFVGRVAHGEGRAYYNAADLFVMASRRIEGEGDVEGFGIVFLEANACGLPVLGGRSGGVVEAVADGESGFLVDPNDPADIARHIVALLRYDELARRLGQQGLRRVRTQFSWRRAAAQVQAMNEALATGSPQARFRLLQGAQFLLRKQWAAL